MKFSMSEHFFISAMKYEDAPLLAPLHKKCFAPHWSAEDFQTFLADPHMFGFVARQIGAYQHAVGFILIRFVAKEAEIITIAVTPNFRNHGVGYALLARSMRKLAQARAEKIFLEVEEHNHAAQTLYKKLQFSLIGRRQAYYQNANKERFDALVLCYNFAQKNINREESFIRSNPAVIDKEKIVEKEKKV